MNREIGLLRKYEALNVDPQHLGTKPGVAARECNPNKEAVKAEGSQGCQSSESMSSMFSKRSCLAKASG